MGMYNYNTELGTFFQGLGIYRFWLHHIGIYATLGYSVSLRFSFFVCKMDIIIKTGYCESWELLLFLLKFLAIWKAPPPAPAPGHVPILL